VQFTDKTGYGVLRVDVGETSEKWTSAELAAKIAAIFKERYKAMSKYSAGSPKKISDTKSALYFKFEYQKTPMTGDAFLEWHGKYITVLTLVMPTDQYSKNKKAAYVSIDSFQFMPKQTNDAENSEAITELEDYEHPKGAFTIKYPAGWEVDDRSSEGEAVVVFQNPNGVSFVMVEVYPTSKNMTKKEVVAKLESVVDESIGKNVDNYEEKPAKGIDNDSASKVFQFTIKDADDNEVSVAGVMILQEHDGMLSYLRVVLPTDMTEANSDMLDEIGNSFTVNTDAEF